MDEDDALDSSIQDKSIKYEDMGSTGSNAESHTENNRRVSDKSSMNDKSMKYEDKGSMISGTESDTENNTRISDKSSMNDNKRDNNLKKEIENYYMKGDDNNGHDTKYDREQQKIIQQSSILELLSKPPTKRQLTPIIRKKAVIDEKDQLSNLNLLRPLLIVIVTVLAMGTITVFCMAVAFVEITSLKSEITLLLVQSDMLNISQKNFNSSLLLISGSTLAKMEPRLMNLQIVLNNPGQFQQYPDYSCASILKKAPSSSSGYYWVRALDGSSIHVYCDMTRSCGGIAGGWMKVAGLDMTERTAVCPFELELSLQTSSPACVLKSADSFCSSTFYESDIIVGYSEICGMIKGFQLRSPDGFRRVVNGVRPHGVLTTDSNYVDGVSLTYGFNPRKHIWSFAAGSCPCSDSKPEFVKNAFFCDGVPHPQCFQYCDNVLLWEGVGCSIQNSSWFYQQLDLATVDSIEMRLCRDQNRDDEDIAIEVVSLYVR